jgi:hypothetical protein
MCVAGLAAGRIDRSQYLRLSSGGGDSQQSGRCIAGKDDGVVGTPGGAVGSVAGGAHLER